MRVLILASCAVFALTACQMTSSGSTSAMKMQDSPQSGYPLAGKTLAYKDLRFTSHKDGRLTGNDGTMGTWEHRDGKYCRTISVPEKWKGTQCQDYEIVGDQVTITREDGSQITYTIL
ncbi:hypothetical protein [Aliiroseovarius sp. S253]|uniref:hypothetical protein n=1 Tax=Aliiroseovarius sp. S253 TaxID=3415133 RepID=UPI003C7C06A9